MKVKSVVIDGFKSYAQRTVVSGFDPAFNAITGRNGSGKSNILDAICFVLGISNLSQVRAGNLQELVYKQGQTGVVKASVSITFDNSDESQSPVGYSHMKEITVTRQVVIGGRNKYLVNGHVATATTVQNLFHSVQLNVNNPHFLIMQGRITKVLNMKPPEILGMVQEAAGTRMFDQKKDAALRTIAKKQTKVDEITEVLTNEIMPLLEKLRQERSDYEKWSTLNAERERLERFCTAYKFAKAMQLLEEAESQAAGMQAQMTELTTKAAEHKAEAAEADAQIKELTARKQQTLEGSFRDTQAREEDLSKKLVQVNSTWQNQQASLKDEQKAAAGLEKQRAEADAAIDALTTAVASHRAAADAAKQAAVDAREQVAVLQRQAQAVQAGLASGADGDDGAEGNLADQLKAAQRAAQERATEARGHEMKAKALRDRVKALKKQVKKEEKDAAALNRKLSAAETALGKAEAKLERLGFSPEEEEALTTQRGTLATEVDALSDKCDNLEASLSARLRFDYDAAAVDRACGGRAGAGAGAGAKGDRVKGVVAKLITVKDTAAATALEVSAGDKLYQVVVDTEVTGKALLQKGKLRRRVTVIPLNKIRRSTLRDSQIEAARRVSRGAAVPALSLVGYTDEVEAAMEYVFGRAFVCPDSDTAQAVTFHKDVRARTVTLDGDMFDPSGTLSGGSRRQAGAVLVKLQELTAAREALGAKKEQLAALDRRIAGLEAASARFTTLSGEADIQRHKVELLRGEVAASQHQQLVDELAAVEAQVEAATQGVDACLAAAEEARAAVARIEGDMRNVEERRQQAIKEVDAKIAAAKKAATKAAAKATKLEQKAEETEMELESTKTEREALFGQIAAASSAVERLASEVATLEARVAEMRTKYEAARAELEEQRQAVAACDTELKALMAAKTTATKAATAAELKARKVEHDIARMRQDKSSSRTTVERMLKKHPWIETERQFFGKAHTDYDFDARDSEQAVRRMNKLDAKLNKLAKTLNKKVVGMIETAEKEYTELMKKKRIIENDKSKIERVIKELDETKNKVLVTTCDKVGRDFASIFSTLLPGTTAKLEPPEGCSVLDGLEVRVAFNGVWKESLTELSGGQRSLLALSLILSMLLFKPAPMYILDEVDAALDLSHTQNIGHMLRTHFTNSQFIVVSLKQGMFNNANVVFKTKFVDGVSTVTRTVPARSKLRGAGAGSGAGHDDSGAVDAENLGTKGARKSAKTAAGATAATAARRSRSRKAVA